MVDEGSDTPERGVRQYKIVVTESRVSPWLSVDLWWREFPCRANHWIGPKRHRIQGGPWLINSQQSLQEVLGALADREWQ